MISIKKYLDSHQQSKPAAAPEPDELSAATMDAYRATLLAIGKTAVQINPDHGAELESNLRGIEHRLSVGYSPDSVKRTERQVEVQLSEWGTRASAQYKAQADEVKELLLALAKTAESVGSRDKGFSSRFGELTGRLEKVAHLNDLTQIRASLVERVAELKSNVDQMTRENQQLVAQLRAEVSIYETRLKSVEHLALKDQLTNLANRRSIEERIQWNIENAEEFSVAMIDLDRFKQVNDEYGHVAGDDLLKQFATELQLNTRSGDLVGRWGGDEFVVVLACNLNAAKLHIERVQQWVLGKYTLHGGSKAPIVLQVDASIGAAQWREGQTMAHLIAEADEDMYMDKKLTREKVS
ncbi:MAG: GGDEF domain-containing protein [Terracidiphilus sp.]|jgi:diguanylate cyclase (GGDEF)-like protein